MKYLGRLVVNIVVIWSLSISVVFAHSLPGKANVFDDLIHQLTSTHHFFIYTIIMILLVAKYIGISRRKPKNNKKDTL